MLPSAQSHTSQHFNHTPLSHRHNRASDVERKALDEQPGSHPRDSTILRVRDSPARATDRLGVNDHIKANLEKIMRNADAAGGDSNAQWTAYLTLPHTQEALKACLRHRTWIRTYGNDPSKKLAIGRKTYSFGGRVTSFLSGAQSSSTPSRR